MRPCGANASGHRRVYGCPHRGIICQNGDRNAVNQRIDRAIYRTSPTVSTGRANGDSPLCRYDGDVSRIAGRGKRLYVVSSKHSVPLQRNLSQANMAAFFTAVCGSDQVDHYKPAPDGVLNLLSRFDLDPQSSVMIGDAKYDIQMGHNADVTTAGALWGAADPAAVKTEQPTYLLDRPQDLLKI